MRLGENVFVIFGELLEEDTGQREFTLRPKKTTENFDITVQL
jgi:hypothetical protein